MEKRAVCSSVAAAGFFGTCLAQAAPPPAQEAPKVEVKITKLAPSLAELDTGVAGNIGVSFGDDGVFLVDDQFAPLHPKIKAAIATLSKKRVRFVFNTHWHHDHTGDNANMAADGATIVAHDAVLRRLGATQHGPMDGSPVPPSPPAALPIITFDHELTFHLNGDTAHVFHVEHAHTDGDAIVHFETANVVHMGDTFFSRGYPLIDVGAGGSIDGYVTASERVLKMIDDKTQVIPGHGPLANKARLAQFHDMVKTIRDKVAALKKRKLTVEQVIAAKPTAAYDAEWGGGFIKPDTFVKWVYETVGVK